MTRPAKPKAKSRTANEPPKRLDYETTPIRENLLNLDLASEKFARDETLKGWFKPPSTLKDWEQIAREVLPLPLVKSGAFSFHDIHRSARARLAKDIYLYDTEKDYHEFTVSPGRNVNGKLYGAICGAIGSQVIIDAAISKKEAISRCIKYFNFVRPERYPLRKPQKDKWKWLRRHHHARIVILALKVTPLSGG